MDALCRFAGVDPSDDADFAVLTAARRDFLQGL